MVTVPCRCSRCAGNRWSLNVASHMVWARWCPCTTQMHTLVSIQSLCTDPVNQTSLTVPLDLTVIKSEYTSTRYRAPPLPAFIAGNTDLLIHKLRRAPSRDFLHTMPVSYIKQYVSCVCVSVSRIFLRFRYQTRRSSLLSPASHSLCALRIHDAKVRSANGFNGAPTIEISLRRPLLARY